MKKYTKKDFLEYASAFDYQNDIDEGNLTGYKTDKEITELYGDYLKPIDENETHQPRKSYINKKEYTKSYKDAVELMAFKQNKKLFPNLNNK